MQSPNYTLVEEAIAKLADRSFHDLTLMNCHLGDVELAALAPRIISFANQIQVANFGCNELQEVPWGILDHLSELRQLSLSENNIKAVDGNRLKRLTKLQQLSLAKNPLETLPREIGEMKNLSRLYLFSCKLQALPFELTKLDLCVLILENNPLLKPAELQTFLRMNCKKSVFQFLFRQGLEDAKTKALQVEAIWATHSSNNNNSMNISTYLQSLPRDVVSVICNFIVRNSV